MQPAIAFAKQLAAIPFGLAASSYVARLATDLAHEEAVARLRSLHESGYQSAWYDREEVRIRFRDWGQLIAACQQVGDDTETFERRFLDLRPSRWDSLIARMRRDPAVGVFNFCIRDAAERSRLYDVPVAMGDCNLLNAGAILVPGGGECVLLNSGINTAGDLARLLYRFASSDGEALSDEAMAASMRGFLAVAALTTLGSTDLDLAAEGITRANAERSESGIDTRGTIVTMFVLLHEYGHIQMEHLDLIRNVNSARLSNAEREALCKQMRQCEYEADHWAYSRMLKADWHACAFERDPHGRITAALGISFAFELLHLAELFRASGDYRFATHPPARKRQSKFLDYCSALHINGDFVAQAHLMSKFVELLSSMKLSTFRKSSPNADAYSNARAT